MYYIPTLIVFLRYFYFWCSLADRQILYQVLHCSLRRRLSNLHLVTQLHPLCPIEQSFRSLKMMTLAFYNPRGFHCTHFHKSLNMAGSSRPPVLLDHKLGVSHTVTGTNLCSQKGLKRRGGGAMSLDFQWIPLRCRH